MIKKKSAQEEIAGFGIILIVIAVIAVVFISLSLNKAQKQELEDYESSGFLSALMEKTTDCEKNAKFLSVKDLIFECGRDYNCVNGENSCNVLNETLGSSLRDNWQVGQEYPIKGYNLMVNYENELYFNITSGNLTSEYKGAMQNYSKINENAEFYFRVYY